MNEIEKNRVTRWRVIAERKLAQLEPNKYRVPIALYERLEGKPAVEVVLDCLARRIEGEGQPWTFYRESDDSRDGDAAYEKDVVHGVVSTLIFNMTPFRAGEGLEEFLAKFYRRGDYNTNAAVDRACKFAMGDAQ